MKYFFERRRRGGFAKNAENFQLNSFLIWFSFCVLCKTSASSAFKGF
jgi:hypothetical protein